MPMKPDREGFVTSWMIQGPEVTPYTGEGTEKNDLRMEGVLRERLSRHLPLTDMPVDAGSPGRLGLPWRAARGAFVNVSDFYATMQTVRFDCAACLISSVDREVTATLWSYAAVDCYLNGEKVGEIKNAVYKPMSHAGVTLPLRKGRNLLYLACETLGVRDTRSVAGVQLRGGEGITTDLPDREAGTVCTGLWDFLDGIRVEKTRLVFPGAAPSGLRMTYKHGDPDLVKTRIPALWEGRGGRTEVTLKEGEAYVTLCVETPYGDVRRRIERTEQILPQVIRPVPSYEENLQLIYRRIAEVETLSRGEKFGFPVSNMLARKYLGDTSRDDARLMDEMLYLIEKRVDCSDFLVCGLIRYVKNYPVDAKVEARIREVLLGYRYWVDMEGLDGMCFWSENHTLMFYASAMHAGEMYPDAYFPRAGMTGRELAALGRKRILSWLSDIEAHGFEEFLSTVYMCVTFAALLNVIDYSDAEISARARAITDRLLRMLAMHVFRGGIIAPQGRVYRGVLYPFRQGAMALMNLLDPSQPYDYGEGWLGFLATSSYRPPEGLKEEMEREISLRYSTGNAEIILEKHRDWCLTSVASPRKGFLRWHNIWREPGAELSGHEGIKSFNECFHGTTCFAPATWGYQQHMWYAALSGEAAVFVNHPGATDEGGDMRPGYWHGNGVMPALKQEGNILLAIYRIPDTHPLHFVHLYVPLCRFDEVREKEGWLFLRKDTGYLGVFSSVDMEDWSEYNVECEKRMYGDEIGIVVRMGGREFASLEAFMDTCLSDTPFLYADALIYGNHSLVWEQGTDDTQYL
ncbi:MAG: hypothetical protein IJ708_06060 [Clostridia bacterium]|nr:hypothetical protein [Clostridia bacterium]